MALLFHSCLHRKEGLVSLSRGVPPCFSVIFQRGTTQVTSYYDNEYV